MKALRPIPDAVRAAQARASDPAASAFVSANAGSGKTHVLVQRVIRLLLDGVPPEKILCITFTKAAAANMAERVFTTLGHWVTLDDERARAGDPRGRHCASQRHDCAARRRKLFACALETPGGLKVQTIHALCTRLLQQFPFEANVPARFAVLDERDQTEMMERANLAVLLEAVARSRSATGRALTMAMASAADVTFKDVVREACLSRDHFMAWTDARRQRRRRCGADLRGARRQRRRPDRGHRARDRRRAASAASALAGDRVAFSIRAARPTRNRPRDCARRWRSPAARRPMNIWRVPHGNRPRRRARRW